jgi:hypothetical protein
MLYVLSVRTRSSIERIKKKYFAVSDKSREFMAELIPSQGDVKKIEPYATELLRKPVRQCGTDPLLPLYSQL